MRAASSIGNSVRRAGKPACISALAARAIARRSPSAGQSRASGKRSAAHSQIARLSQIARPSTFSTGILPEGEPASRMASAVSSRRSRTIRSVNGAPARFSTSHGRMDQDDHALSPITSSTAAPPVPALAPPAPLR